MKSVVAALLLLFQLQPFAGAAVCLGMAAQAAQAECNMPEHETAPTQRLTPTTPVSPQPCPIAAMCAPAALAVPEFADQLVRDFSHHPAPAVTINRSPADIYSSPPFHPPKV